jgi:LPS sulfotransferase NodH
VYFKQYSRGHEYSYKLENIAAFYKAYRDLMDYWKGLFGPRILEISYEDLVRSPDDAAAKLYRFCGIPNRSAVGNRTKFTATEIGHWRSYEPYLAPLIDALEGRPLAMSRTNQK